MFGHQRHPQRLELYTRPRISQRLFVTNPTKIFTQFGGILRKSVVKLTVIQPYSYTTPLFPPSGQVAQLVERGPEKAGVGGSIPSLATINLNNLPIAQSVNNFLAHTIRVINSLTFHFWRRSFERIAR